ncbi:MAG: peptide chain release factor N(5)-glutamine methyltransferase [Candidatus Puniceispirillaceae bacterium]
MDARTILNGIAARLDAAGIDTARLDARILLAIALGRDDAVLPHETLPHWDDDLEDAVASLVNRRLAGEPVSRIRGWREFWSLRFLLSPDTLDPRPDSETLVAAALDAGRLMSAPRLLDLGTGSGCLLLACLSELPDATGLGLDISSAAIGIAAQNATQLALAERADFETASFADDLDVYGTFDLVISNPPYIPVGEVATLAPEVTKFDPVRALDGGEDGLASWRDVLPAIARRLAADGQAFVEIGAGQQAAVTGIAADCGLTVFQSHADLAGIVRCLGMRHAAASVSSGG